MENRFYNKYLKRYGNVEEEKQTKSDRVNPSHDELKVKVDQFKSKLEDLEKLYQAKGNNRNKCDETDASSVISKDDSQLVSNKCDGKEDISSDIGNKIQYDDPTKEDDKTDKLSFQRNSFSRIPKRRNHRRSTSDIGFKILFERNESYCSSYDEEEFTETEEEHALNENRLTSFDEESNNQHPSRYLKRQHSQVNFKIIQNLKRDNKILLKRCQSFSFENRKLRSLSQYWSHKMKEAEEKMNEALSEKKRVLTEYEKICIQKEAVDSELLKSHQALCESSKLQTGIDELLQKLQKDQDKRNMDVEEVKKENIQIKEQLEEMKKICMENDSKIRHYQNLEIKLQECLQKASEQISQMELQTKQRSVKDNIMLERISEDYEFIHRENEVLKMMYGDSLQKIQALMEEIDEYKCQLGYQTRKTNTLNVPLSNRRRWTTSGYDSLKKNMTSEDEYSSDASSSFNSPLKTTSKIPRRSCSFKKPKNKTLIASDRESSTDFSISYFTRPGYNSPLRRSSTYSIKDKKELDVFESQKNSEVETIKKEVDITKENNTKNQEELLHEKPEKLSSTKPPIENTNDTDDEKLKRDQKNTTWFVPTTDKDGKTKVTAVPMRKNKESESSATSTTQRKSYIDQIVHPSVTTDEVLKSVTQTKLDRNSNNKFTSPTNIPRKKTQVIQKNEKDERKSFNEKLDMLNKEKDEIESSLSKIPSRGSWKRDNGTSNRYWTAQEEKLEKRFDDVKKEINTLKNRLRQGTAV